MLRTKNWGREKKIGDVIVWWTLAEALNWRRKHNRRISIDKAFEELRGVCSPKHAKDGEQWLVWASGRKTGWSPMLGWRSGKLPPHRAFEDPPVHDPQADLIPADEWRRLALSSADEIADGKLDYAYERTRAWEDVRFPRDELIAVWRRLFKRACADEAEPESRGRPGPKPVKREAMGNKMHADLLSGRLTVENLESETLETLIAEYAGTLNPKPALNTAGAARKEAIKRFLQFQNSETLNNSENL